VAGKKGDYNFKAAGKEKEGRLQLPGGWKKGRQLRDGWEKGRLQL
jgi:hypothetical protein